MNGGMNTFLVCSSEGHAKPNQTMTVIPRLGKDRVNAPVRAAMNKWMGAEETNSKDGGN